MGEAEEMLDAIMGVVERLVALLSLGTQYDQYDQFFGGRERELLQARSDIERFVCLPPPWCPAATSRRWW
jgi:hypothetical protein